MPTLGIDQLASRRLQRADIAMLEALEAAPKHTMKLEDTEQSVPTGRMLHGGRTPEKKKVLVPGLFTTVNQFCNDHPHLMEILFKEEERLAQGRMQKFVPEPYYQRCDIARLEQMVPDLIEHVGQADERSCQQPTRDLKITDNGLRVLEMWRAGQFENQGLPHPDPAGPAAEPERRKPGRPRKDEAETPTETQR